MMQLEARMEEINQMKDRVKILKEFQLNCKKRTGRALSQKRDARVQLISVAKPRTSSKPTDKKVSAMFYGPVENSHVATFREVLTKYPVSLSRDRWSEEEKENLAKGVKQQFQEMLLQRSLDQLSDSNGSSGDIDKIIASIREIDITPEITRLFLPKVIWEKVASMYVPGRSGAECQARWLNFEDPLINHQPWSKMEDKNLLHIIQRKGMSNWIDIAASLGTNRTPAQCLARYQRSLNASIIKREWTDEDDKKLRAAVETYGEGNWLLIASTIEGRTGSQCSNRWIKSLHPVRKKVGRWTVDEDKRLRVSAMLFGPKNWRKIAQYVPGRTHVQCRERWVNSLDPSLNLERWSEKEDALLKAAIQEHGYCWSKIAACIPPRTDNQCRRRWKLLFPHEVPLLQEARKIQKVALISNFVDRESERPALGPNDFILPPPAFSNIEECENPNLHVKRKSRSRRKGGSAERDTSPGNVCPEDVLRLTNGNEIENSSANVTTKKKRGKRISKAKNHLAASADHLPPCSDSSEHPAERSSDDYCASHLLSCPDPNLTRITFDDVGELGLDGAMVVKRPSKLQPRRRCRKLREEVPVLSASNGVGTSGRDATTNERSGSKPHSRKRVMNVTHDKQSNRLDSSSLVEGEVQNVDTALVESSPHHSPPLRCSTPEILENGCSRSLVGYDWPGRSNMQEAGEEDSQVRILETQEDDNMTLASFVKSRFSNKILSSSVKSSKLCLKRNSSAVLGNNPLASDVSVAKRMRISDAEGDDIALVLFCNKLKRRINLSVN